MASDCQNSTARPWLIPAFIVLATILAWTFFTARGAGSHADDLEATLMVPELDLAVVAGAPQRFEERFASALEDVGEEAEAPADDLRWATLVIANHGRAEAEDVVATLSLAPELEPTFLADLDGFGDMTVEPGEEGITLELDGVDEGDSAMVFVGFQPDALPAGLADGWAGAYERTVDRIEVAGDVASSVYYGDAL